MPLPHPSWRTRAWVTRNPWFETDLIPHLRQTVAALMNR
jgi:uracil-DNA glycosylase